MKVGISAEINVKLFTLEIKIFCLFSTPENYPKCVTLWKKTNATYVIGTFFISLPPVALIRSKTLKILCNSASQGEICVLIITWFFFLKVVYSFSWKIRVYHLTMHKSSVLIFRRSLMKIYRDNSLEYNFNAHILKLMVLVAMWIL